MDKDWKKRIEFSDKGESGIGIYIDGEADGRFEEDKKMILDFIEEEKEKSFEEGVRSILYPKLRKSKKEVGEGWIETN